MRRRNTPTPKSQSGKIGYILAWLLGIPISGSGAGNSATMPPRTSLDGWTAGFPMREV